MFYLGISDTNIERRPIAGLRDWKIGRKTQRLVINNSFFLDSIIIQQHAPAARVYIAIFRVREKVKVKFSHTRYRALGPELIPVYRQSARR